MFNVPNGTNSSGYWVAHIFVYEENKHTEAIIQGIENTMLNVNFDINGFKGFTGFVFLI